MSATKAAQTMPAAARQGAKVEDASQLTPIAWLAILAALLGGGFLISEAISP